MRWTKPGLGVSVPTSPVPLLAKAARVEKEESYSDAQESQHISTHVRCHWPFDWWTRVCLSLTEPFYQHPCYLLQISIFLGVGASYGEPQYPWVPLTTAEQSRLSGPGDILHMFPFSVPTVLCLRELIWETIQNPMMSETGAFREASDLKVLGKGLGPLKSQRLTTGEAWP